MHLKRRPRTIPPRLLTRLILLPLSCLSLLVAGTGCALTGARSVPPDKLALGALGVDHAARSQLRELYTKAIDDGESMVIVYGANEANFDPVNKAFSERFPGIKVVGEPYTGAQLESRLAIESSSGKHVADVLENTTYEYRNSGYYQPYTPFMARRLPKRFRDETGQLWGPSGTLFGFTYNSRMIAPADAPRSWADLTDPKYRGQIAAGDPSQPSAVSDMLIKLRATGVIDDAWLKRVAAGKPGIKHELELANSAVARGEYGISLVNIYNFYAQDKAKGAPITFVYPDDGVMIEPNYYGLLKGATHPYAARLFLNWLFTDEAQRAYAKLGVYPLMPGADTGKALPPMKSLNVLKVPDPAAMESLWGPGTARLHRYFGGAAAD